MPRTTQDKLRGDVMAFIPDDLAGLTVPIRLGRLVELADQLHLLSQDPVVWGSFETNREALLQNYVRNLMKTAERLWTDP